MFCIELNLCLYSQKYIFIFFMNYCLGFLILYLQMLINICYIVLKIHPAFQFLTYKNETIPTRHQQNAELATVTLFHHVS